MITEKTPKRPDSYLARVLPYVRLETPRWVIEEKTGIVGPRLTDTIKSIRSNGYVPRLSQDEQTYMHKVNTSYGRGGIWLKVSEFFPLDLTSKQTQIALRLKEVELSQHQIATAYAREMHRHSLQRPVTELTIEAQRDKRRSEEELARIVGFRQDAYNEVVEKSWKKPSSLRGWHLLEGVIDEESKETLLELLGSRDLFPQDALAQRYLLRLHEARQLWIQQRDSSVLINFRRDFNEIDPGITSRLEDAIARVVKVTSNIPNE